MRDVAWAGGVTQANTPVSGCFLLDRVGTWKPWALPPGRPCTIGARVPQSKKPSQSFYIFFKCLRCRIRQGSLVSRANQRGYFPPPSLHKEEAEAQTTVCPGEFALRHVGPVGRGQPPLAHTGPPRGRGLLLRPDPEPGQALCLRAFLPAAFLRKGGLASPVSTNAASKGRISRQGAEAGGLISGPGSGHQPEGMRRGRCFSVWGRRIPSSCLSCFLSGGPRRCPRPPPQHPGPRRVRLAVSDWAGTASQGPQSPPRLFLVTCPLSKAPVGVPAPLPHPQGAALLRMLPGWFRGCGQSWERGHPPARAHVALCWHVAATLEGSPGCGLYVSA